jgi:hypothetical protein
MNHQLLQQFIDKTWDSTIIPTLMEYIYIPNKSPQFDPDWQANGHMDKAVQLIATWCKQQTIKNLSVEVIVRPPRQTT